MSAGQVQGAEYLPLVEERHPDRRPQPIPQMGFIHRELPLLGKVVLDVSAPMINNPCRNRLLKGNGDPGAQLCGHLRRHRQKPQVVSLRYCNADAVKIDQIS